VQCQRCAREQQRRATHQSWQAAAARRRPCNAGPAQRSRSG
jgi:hypothetical protein